LEQAVIFKMNWTEKGQVMERLELDQGQGDDLACQLASLGVLFRLQDDGKGMIQMMITLIFD
jgi:hypothetical protein